MGADLASCRNAKIPGGYLTNDKATGHTYPHPGKLNCTEQGCHQLTLGPQAKSTGQEPAMVGPVGAEGSQCQRRQLLQGTLAAKIKHKSVQSAPFSL